MKFFETDRHDANGFEKVEDAVPVDLPVGFRRPLSIHEQIARALRSHQVRVAQDARGEETLEESMDFDTGEDDFPTTVHELRDEQEQVVLAGAAELARRARIAEVERLKADKAEMGRRAEKRAEEVKVARKEPEPKGS